jgi:hypothetical protein
MAEWKFDAAWKFWKHGLWLGGLCITLRGVLSVRYNTCMVKGERFGSGWGCTHEIMETVDRLLPYGREIQLTVFKFNSIRPSNMFPSNANPLQKYKHPLLPRLLRTDPIP